MAVFKCSACGNTLFTFVEKDNAHTGLYCDVCGRWLKWVKKKEYANKSVVPFDVFMSKVNANKRVMSEADVPENSAGHQHISNVNDKTESVEIPVQSQAVQPSKVQQSVEQSTQGVAMSGANLQVHIAPRSEVTILTSEGESLKMSNILIKVNRSGICITDATGDVVRRFNFD